MSENKTKPQPHDPAAFIDTVEPTGRREDAKKLLTFLGNVTGFEPVMWGPSIIGYGRYHYVYASGREGDYLATGFAPRRAHMVVYIMPGYADFGDILGRLGKHRLGKSCLYLGRLSSIDMDVLAELIRAGLQDLGQRWKVHPS